MKMITLITAAVFAFSGASLATPTLEGCVGLKPVLTASGDVAYWNVSYCVDVRQSEGHEDKVDEAN